MGMTSVYEVNELFFKNWSNNMAYILGFTCADGCVYKTSLSWDLSDKYESNKKLLEDFRTILSSNYPIYKRKNSFRLRLSNKKLTNSIKELGVIPNKKKILEFPEVPDEYLRHFIRGFLDGDGWVCVRQRKCGRKEICVGFSNGSFAFMEKLSNLLDYKLNLTSNNLRRRDKITERGIKTTVYQLEYYSKSAYNLLCFLYKGISESDLFLGRKFEKYLEAEKAFKRYSLKNRLWRDVEDRFNKEMVDILSDLIFDEGLSGIQIAKRLGIHSSSVYRWLVKTGLKKDNSRCFEYDKSGIAEA